MTTAIEALEAFKKAAKTTDVKVHTGGPSIPLLKITDEKGTFLRGVLLSQKTVDINSQPTLIQTYKVLETNARAIVKDQKTKQYAEQPIALGGQYAVFAPTQLGRMLKDVPDNTEVFVLYEGKKKVSANGKNFNRHEFTVSKRTEQVPVEGVSDESIPD